MWILFASAVFAMRFRKNEVIHIMCSRSFYRALEDSGLAPQWREKLLPGMCTQDLAEALDEACISFSSTLFVSVTKIDFFEHVKQNIKLLALATAINISINLIIGERKGLIPFFARKLSPDIADSLADLALNHSINYSAFFRKSAHTLLSDYFSSMITDPNNKVVITSKIFLRAAIDTFSEKWEDIGHISK